MNSDGVEIKGPKTVSIQVLWYVLVLAFMLGGAWIRFQSIEIRLDELIEEETGMATKEELEVLEERLRKWIERVESVHEEREALDRTIYRLELYHELEGRTDGEASGSSH